MTKDESIALAEKLGKEYMSLTQMQAKISEYEDRLSKPVDDSRKHANVFDFFSKCLGGSIITAFILAIPGYFWAGMANYIAKSNGTYTHDHLIDVIALIVIIFALIHLIGGFVARKRLKDFNHAEDDRIQADIKLRESMKHDVEELKEMFSKETGKLSEYDSLVPEEYRTYGSMLKVKTFLTSGKAETFEEALDLIKTDNDNDR